ncbi:MAG TPA: hypothetical protein PK765_02125 [bacterium]|nr:hypothetical protein [bacterium]
MQDSLRAVIEFVSGASQSFFGSAVSLYESFFTDLSVDSIIRMVIIYAFVIWAAFVIWVIKDITNRTTSILLQVFSILLVIALTPLFGLPIYLLIRPASTLFERSYYEEYDEDDEALIHPSVHSCPKCSYIVEERFRYCPACGFECTTECTACGERIREGRTTVKHCPHCGKPRAFVSDLSTQMSPPLATQVSSPLLTSVDPETSAPPSLDLAPVAVDRSETNDTPPSLDVSESNGEKSADTDHLLRFDNSSKVS